MSDPTPAQLVAFRAYVQAGSLKEAAHVLGVSVASVKRHLSEMYARLDVSGAMEAAAALGWVTLPGDGPAPCGWRGDGCDGFERMSAETVRRVEGAASGRPSEQQPKGTTSL